jgi:EAL domain-containing protein (putative c-di-GMP-specific phosphodiesterase class I)
LILAMIAMAHALGITVVAEGIENPLQLAFLRENHCDFGQGFYFAPPMSAAQLLDLMNSQDLSS